MFLLIAFRQWFCLYISAVLMCANVASSAFVGSNCFRYVVITHWIGLFLKLGFRFGRVMYHWHVPRRYIWWCFKWNPHHTELVIDTCYGFQSGSHSNELWAKYRIFDPWFFLWVPAYQCFVSEYKESNTWPPGGGLLPHLVVLAYLAGVVLWHGRRSGPIPFWKVVVISFRIVLVKVHKQVPFVF